MKKYKNYIYFPDILKPDILSLIPCLPDILKGY